MWFVAFLLYSAFCFWAIFLDGAETIEGWKTFMLFGGFAASLTANELKFYLGVFWLCALVALLFSL